MHIFVQLLPHLQNDAVQLVLLKTEADKSAETIRAVFAPSVRDIVWTD